MDHRDYSFPRSQKVWCPLSWVFPMTACWTAHSRWPPRASCIKCSPIICLGKFDHVYFLAQQTQPSPSLPWVSSRKLHDTELCLISAFPPFDSDIWQYKEAPWVGTEADMSQNQYKKLSLLLPQSLSHPFTCPLELYLYPSLFFLDCQGMILSSSVSAVSFIMLVVSSEVCDHLSFLSSCKLDLLVGLALQSSR